MRRGDDPRSVIHHLGRLTLTDADRYRWTHALADALVEAAAELRRRADTDATDAEDDPP